MTLPTRAESSARRLFGCSLALLLACGSSSEQGSPGETATNGGSGGTGAAGTGGGALSQGGAAAGGEAGTGTGGASGKAAAGAAGAAGTASPGAGGATTSAGAGGASGGSSGGAKGGTAGTNAGSGGAISAGGDGGSGGQTASTSFAVSLRTHDTAQFLSAAGPALTASASFAGASEIFTLTDTNGGDFVDGDELFLETAAGGYVSAVDGGGGALALVTSTPGADETFVVVRIAGPGVIGTGDEIALRTKQKTNYVSAIDGGGGDVRADAPWDKAWETFLLTKDAVPTQPPASREKVLAYLNGISGKKTIAGQQNKDSHDPSSHTDQVAGITGRVAGFWSNDFGFGQYALDGRQTITAEAKKRWAKGDVVQFMYHNCIPTRDELCGWDDIGGAHPQHLGDDEWKSLVTDGTDLNKAWKGRLDTLSPYFADLKAAGVAPLFRPLHEMNQGAFWWGGRGGPDGTRKLFQITHDYLVDTKGFDNIIWVWDVQDFGTLATDVVDYDPGPAYYDIAALDVYDGGYTQQNYDTMLGASAGKPIAIGECAHLPTADELLKQPKWAFFMLWPDFIDQEKSVLPALYNAPNVVTEDQMPGWN